MFLKPYIWNNELKIRLEYTLEIMYPKNQQYHDLNVKVYSKIRSRPNNSGSIIRFTPLRTWHIYCWFGCWSITKVILRIIYSDLHFGIYYWKLIWQSTTSFLSILINYLPSFWTLKIKMMWNGSSLMSFGNSSFYSNNRNI